MVLFCASPSSGIGDSVNPSPTVDYDMILLDELASLMAFIKSSSAVLLICIIPTMGWLQRVMLAFLRWLYQHNTGKRS